MRSFLQPEWNLDLASYLFAFCGQQSACFLTVYKNILRIKSNSEKDKTVMKFPSHYVKRAWKLDEQDTTGFALNFIFPCSIRIHVQTLFWYQTSSGVTSVTISKHQNWHKTQHESISISQRIWSYEPLYDSDITVQHRIMPTIVL